jgi:hypothetical protein
MPAPAPPGDGAVSCAGRARLGGGPAGRPDRGVPLAPHPRRTQAGSFRDPSGKLAGSFREAGRILSGRFEALRTAKGPSAQAGAPPAMARYLALGGRARRGSRPVTGAANRDGFWRFKRHLGQPSRPAAVRVAVADRGAVLAGLGGGANQRAAFVALAEDEAGVHGFDYGKPGSRPRCSMACCCRARHSPSRKPGCSSTWGQG